ncbi:ABC transporter permease [Paenibacillus sp. GCM10027628]|uniref:ABC transporter permease n=1 Tax=Paenibacillus sp. GCM10027628 TaxID=3273413 RepID=UPI00363BF711
MNFYQIYKKYGIYIVLMFVLAFFGSFAPHFMSVDNVMNILRQVSMFGIVVVGVTFVMISGGMDLSVGGQMAVTGMIVGNLMVKMGIGIVPACILGIIIGTLIGAINGLISVKFNILPIIVTLGTMLALQGLAFVITKGIPVFGLPRGFAMLGQGYFGPIPIPVIIFVIVIAVAWFILKKTYFGRYVYAMGGSREAARLAGINIEKMTYLVYALCGFITSIASLIMLSRTNSAQPAAGASYPFDCMTAAVLGGISFAGGEGKVGGAVVGVLIIGILNNGLQLMNVDSNWQGLIKGIVLIAAVGVDSIQRREKKVKLKVKEA